MFVAVSKEIFTRIMTIKSAYKIWSFLQNKYEGDERIKGMQALNLVRKIEMQKMKDSETIKEYANKLLSIANKVRLLGSNFFDSRIVEKIRVSIPERFEATITSLENTKDLSKFTLAKLVNALQAQEKRRMMRQKEVVQGTFHTKTQNSRGDKDKKNNKWRNKKPEGSNKLQGETFPPCLHCKKTNHPQRKCWWRPDVKCKNCGNM